MAVCLRAGTDCAPHQSTQDKAAELRERSMATTWRCKFRWWCLRLPSCRSWIVRGRSHGNKDTTRIKQGSNTSTKITVQVPGYG